MAFTTKLDFSSNRQVKQHIETITVLSGGTSFGVPFNLLPTGPNLTTTALTETYSFIASTFSGNSTTTNYSWYDPRMQLGWSSLSAITPSTSATTQQVLPIFTGNTFITIDGNTSALSYSGLSFDVYVIAIDDLGGGNYSGTVETDMLDIYSASTLDFTGRTIWVDVSGITRTEDLIIGKNPIIGNIWTCIDSEGKGEWLPTTGSTSGTTLYWYSENSTPPTTTPIATGDGSISLGNGAEANNQEMFVYGSQAGSGGIDGDFSNFIGYRAGYLSEYTIGSNYIGFNAGKSSVSGDSSNFIGFNAGFEITNSYLSNFIGPSAGFQNDDSFQSNFIGLNTGYQANNSNDSNFIGSNSGSLAYGASFSNFFGYQTGYQANNSNDSNFIGYRSGYLASGSSGSNFIGSNSGYQTKNASNSNFIGTNAGIFCLGVSYSNLFGYNAGRGYFGNVIGNNNIIIGTNITLPSGATDSINIGGVLFGINTYNTITGDPATGSTASGKIGIGVVTPTEGLDVAGNARFRTIGSLTTAGALYYDANGVLTTSISDERLKTNVNQLTNSLDKVKQLRGVSYNWNENPTGQTKIGFIAQEVNNVVPELTFVNANNPELYMGVHYSDITALLVEAVKELAAGTTSVNNTYLETQTILAEDNNIDLNYSGTPTTAIGGGINVLHAKGYGLSAKIITDVDGNWLTNNDFKPNALTIPLYTPTSTSDINGSEGNLTRDDDYLYIKTSTGWKRTNLENF